MLSPLAASAIVLAALVVLFACARLISRSERVSSEVSRKIVHTGMGIVCLSFPWLFSGILPVLLLGAVAFAAFIALRRVPKLRSAFGCVLHDVRRQSYGEFAFAGGVVCAFVLARGDVLAYCLPVAILAFADTIAALAGARFGRNRFTIFGTTKSLEGSAGFFGGAVICALISLGLAHRSGTMFSATLISVALMTVEAVSWTGLDNFALPVCGTLLLRAMGAWVPVH